MKISEKKALEAYPIDIIPDDDTMGFTSSDRNEVIRLGYIKGYDQAMQDFMEKAEKWLEIHMPFGEVSHESVYDCIQEFKNYMQNEN